MNATPDERTALFALERRTSELLRGLAILLVLFGHTEHIRMGGAGGVALFLILSGYGLNSSCEGGGLADYWPRRIRKVWLPYFFVGVLDVLVQRVRGAGAILCTLLGLDLGLNADPTMWYLSYLFYWYLACFFAALLTRRLEKQGARRALRIALLLLACAPCVLLSARGFWHRGSLSKAYVFFFPLGAAMSCLRGRTAARPLRTALWAAALLVCAAYLCLPLLGVQDLTYLTALAMAGAAIAALQLKPLRGAAERALGCVGAYSYPLYLFEGLFLLRWRVWRGALPAAWMADLAFFAGSGVCAVLYWRLYRAAERRLRAQYESKTENT